MAVDTYTVDITSVLTSTGWTAATVANLTTSNDVRATDGDKDEVITAETTNTPGDFDTPNTIILNIEWRTDATGASRAKSFDVELVDSTETTVYATYTTPTSSGHTTDRTDSSTALDISSRTQANIDGARFRITSKEGGGMADGIKTEIDRVWGTLEYDIAVTTTLVQDSFRFYDDDATPASATAAANEDVNATFDDHERFQLRIGVAETTGGDPASQAYELFAQKNGAGGYSRVTDLTDIRVYLSPNFADDIATTDRLTGPPGTFIAGKADEVDGVMSAVNLAANQNTELVWNLLMKRKNANNDFWDFEVRQAGGTALDTYDIRPRVTMNRRAAELGFIEVKLSTATGGESTRAAGMANIADDSALDLTGEDMEIRFHVYTPTWNPGSTEGNQIFAAHYNSTGSQRAYRTQANESDTAGDIRLQVSETGAAVDVNDSPAIGGADDQEAQYRVVFEGDNASSNHVTTAYSRTASIDADTLDDGGSWGAAKQTVTTTPTIATIHPSTEQFAAFGSTFDNAGGYVGSKFYRLMVWEGFAASGRLAVDVRYYDRMYTAPEATNDELWVNQGGAPGIVTVVGTHVTGWDWVQDIQTVNVGQASETDSAFAVTFTKAEAVSQASETDSAFAVSATLLIAVGQASETDSAPAVTFTKAEAVGQASETDSALAVGSTKTEPVGQASETDSALSVNATVAVAVGQASETDSALAVTFTKTEAVGQASETDSALAVTWTRTEPVGQASETDSALPVTSTLAVPVGQASETDSALAVTWTRTEAVGQASETDSAFVVTVQQSQQIAVLQASETDSAFTVTWTRVEPVGQASEIDSALAVGAIKTVTVGLSIEVDSAFAVTPAAAVGNVPVPVSNMLYSGYDPGTTKGTLAGIVTVDLVGSISDEVRGEA